MCEGAHWLLRSALASVPDGRRSRRKKSLLCRGSTYRHPAAVARIAQQRHTTIGTLRVFKFRHCLNANTLSVAAKKILFSIEELPVAGTTEQSRRLNT